MKRQALVLGAGGHCRVVLSLLFARGDHDPVGILDLAAPSQGEVIMGVPVVGHSVDLALFRARPRLDLFLAIGDNATRRDWWSASRELGFTLPNLVSPETLVDSRSRLGDANVVCARAFIGPGAVIGHNNLLNTACVVEHEVIAGNHCHMATHSTIAGRVRIGDECFVGAGATVIDNISVAAGVTIGAGGTVTRAITEPGGVYVGTPARRLSPRTIT